MTIKIYDVEQDFPKAKASGIIAAKTLEYIKPFIKPGITTNEIDKLCHDFIIQHGATPASLGYNGFPKSVCTSVNHVICHGIPSDKILEEGDIVNVDVATSLDGWIGDTSRTYCVGKVSIKAKRLVDATYEALWHGIRAVRPGGHFGDIGYAIREYIKPFRYSIVMDFCAHGTGQVYHDEPKILHSAEFGTGPVMLPGMIFTIEPMINIGKPDMKILDDNWTAVTRDRSLSAQFEHTIGVTETGYEIFTLVKNEI